MACSPAPIEPKQFRPCVSSWTLLYLPTTRRARANPRPHPHNQRFVPAGGLPDPATPSSNCHSARRLPYLYSPRVPSLGAFRRRPRCLPHCRDGPSSETLHSLRRTVIAKALPVYLRQRKFLRTASTAGQCQKPTMVDADDLPPKRLE